MFFLLHSKHLKQTDELQIDSVLPYKISYIQNNLSRNRPNAGLELSGGWGLNPQFMSTDAHF